MSGWFWWGGRPESLRREPTPGRRHVEENVYSLPSLWAVSIYKLLRRKGKAKQQRISASRWNGVNTGDTAGSEMSQRQWRFDPDKRIFPDPFVFETAG